MIEGIKDVYLDRIKYFSAKLHGVENTSSTVSYLRVFLALGTLVLFYFGLTAGTDFFYLVIFFVLIFIFFVFVHARLFKKRDLLRNSVLINQQEVKYLHQDYSSFKPGDQFIDHSHPYTFDLDIFGSGSIYQSMNRTVTFKGSSLLAKSLCYKTSKAEILARQQSVRELKEKLEFRQRFQATGMMLNESAEDREKFTIWLNEKFHFIGNKWLPLLYILPFISVVFLIISLIKSEIHPGLYLSVFLNWIVYGLNAKKVIRIYSLVSKKKILLQAYSDLFSAVEVEKFNSPKLVELRNQIQNASSQFKKLADYVALLDQRLNVFVSPVVNTFFLYDLQWCLRIEKWRLENDQQMLAWMEALGEMDFLCTLGNFHYNNPEFSFPEIVQDELVIQAQGVGHPLINRNKRVPNDFKLGGEEHIAIITGANMAGKSTFLRVIGINTVLAYTGAPVCASAFKIGLMDLISSMRITDSLKDDVSYFYAELQRLKLIRQKAESGQPTLILLDEMLRGTNSKDKQQGSKSFVENLLGFNCLSLVATHDLLLGDLEQEYPPKIKNYSFESILVDNELRFDYTIKKGVAKNTNASFLMKKLGII